MDEVLHQHLLSDVSEEAQLVAINHIIISGTGRAGTTFLMQILSEIGMDTGFNDSYMNINKNCNAGLEKDIFAEDAPYIIKSPWISDQIEIILKSGHITIDHAIIPIRDLFAAAESRRDVTRRSASNKKHLIPGGLWHTSEPEMQENVLAMQLYKLIHPLVQNDIPITMLDFPRFALDKEYFYRKMLHVFPSLDQKIFDAAFDKIADSSKIHEFKIGSTPNGKQVSVKLIQEPENIRREIETITSNAMFWQPQHLVNAISWIGHIPFAFWLTEKMHPKVFVELGTHTGNSYFAFCQAIQMLNLQTKAYAVDTWKGDPQAGYYGEEVFDFISGCNAQYSSFSTLVRSTFDEALSAFADNTVDLLHIDGFHSYEAVKHDFESWLPKLAGNAIVLFHDTNVDQEGFGVKQYFSELKIKYPYFEMEHSYGLGVLKIGNGHNSDLKKIFDQNNPVLISALKERFSVLGDGLLNKLLASRRQRLLDKITKIKEITQSVWWMITKPLRWLKKRP